MATLVKPAPNRSEAKAALATLLMFVVAAAVLLLMVALVQPILILATAAFFLMLGLTGCMARQLSSDLACAADKANLAGFR